MGFVSPIAEEARRDATERTDALGQQTRAVYRTALAEEARLKAIAAGLSDAEKHRLLTKLVETYRANLVSWHQAMTKKKCAVHIEITYENGSHD